MTKKSTPPVFLGRASYRQRRMRDAARVLPVFGVILWTIPVLWAENERAPTSNADAMFYIFGAWVALIALSALITRALRETPEDS